MRPEAQWDRKPYIPGSPSMPCFGVLLLINAEKLGCFDIHRSLQLSLASTTLVLSLYNAQAKYIERDRNLLWSPLATPCRDVGGSEGGNVWCRRRVALALSLLFLWVAIAAVAWITADG